MVDELATEAGVHPVHLSPVFRKFGGKQRQRGEQYQDSENALHDSSMALPEDRVKAHRA